MTKITIRQNYQQQIKIPEFPIQCPWHFCWYRSWHIMHNLRWPWRIITVALSGSNLWKILSFSRLSVIWRKEKGAWRYHLASSSYTYMWYFEANALSSYFIGGHFFYPTRSSEWCRYFVCHIYFVDEFRTTKLFSFLSIYRP